MRRSWLLAQMCKFILWLFTFRDDRGRIKLARLVLVGSLTVIATGGALFLWLAWLSTGEVSPWRTGWSKSSSWAWLKGPTGPNWFEASKTTAAILAIIGLGGAALVAYRRQDLAEQSHKLETDRHQADREREMRSRFTVIAEQLSGQSTTRLAGAYALAALADDWHRFDNDGERQVCVDLLCGQLRHKPIRRFIAEARQSSELVENFDAVKKLIRDDEEFRRTVIAIAKVSLAGRPFRGENGVWSPCRRRGSMVLRGRAIAGRWGSRCGPFIVAVVC
ncbi:MAG: hypothetical protein WBB57_26185 [Mycobacterium sp.]